jgi:large subunit ribosomal protein L17
MNKRKRGRKLSRQTDQRRALLRILATHLILKERIKTTKAKAKEAGAFVERMITRAKQGNLASTRFLARFFAPPVVKKLMQELAGRYAARQGGYTRIIRLGPRPSDRSQMAILELVK